MGNRKSRNSSSARRKPAKQPEVVVKVIRPPALPPFDRVLDSAMMSIATHLVTAGEHTAEAYKQLALASIEHQRALGTLARLMEIRRGNASELKIEYELIDNANAESGVARAYTETVE